MTKSTSNHFVSQAQNASMEINERERKHSSHPSQSNVNGSERGDYLNHLFKNRALSKSTENLSLLSSKPTSKDLLPKLKSHSSEMDVGSKMRSQTQSKKSSQLKPSDKPSKEDGLLGFESFKKMINSVQDHSRPNSVRSLTSSPISSTPQSPETFERQKNSFQFGNIRRDTDKASLHGHLQPSRDGVKPHKLSMPTRSLSSSFPSSQNTENSYQSLPPPTSLFINDVSKGSDSESWTQKILDHQKEYFHLQKNYETQSSSCSLETNSLHISNDELRREIQIEKSKLKDIKLAKEIETDKNIETTSQIDELNSKLTFNVKEISRLGLKKVSLEGETTRLDEDVHLKEQHQTGLESKKLELKNKLSEDTDRMSELDNDIFNLTNEVRLLEEQKAEYINCEKELAIITQHNATLTMKMFQSKGLDKTKKSNSQRMHIEQIFVASKVNNSKKLSPRLFDYNLDSDSASSEPSPTIHVLRVPTNLDEHNDALRKRLRNDLQIEETLNNHNGRPELLEVIKEADDDYAISDKNSGTQSLANILEERSEEADSFNVAQPDCTVPSSDSESFVEKSSGFQRATTQYSDETTPSQKTESVCSEAATLASGPPSPIIEPKKSVADLDATIVSELSYSDSELARTTVFNSTSESSPGAFDSNVKQSDSETIGLLKLKDPFEKQPYLESHPLNQKLEHRPQSTLRARFGNKSPVILINGREVNPNTFHPSPNVLEPRNHLDFPEALPELERTQLDHFGNRIIVLHDRSDYHESPILWWLKFLILSLTLLWLIIFTVLMACEYYIELLPPSSYSSLAYLDPYFRGSVQSLIETIASSTLFHVP